MRSAHGLSLFFSLVKLHLTQVVQAVLRVKQEVAQEPFTLDYSQILVEVIVCTQINRVRIVVNLKRSLMVLTKQGASIGDELACLDS